MNNSKNKQVKALKKRVEFLEKQVDGLNIAVFSILHELSHALDFLRYGKLDDLDRKIFECYMTLRVRNNGVNSEGSDD